MRDLHVVVPTIGRGACESVVRRLVEREPRVARITVVSQETELPFLAALEKHARSAGVLLHEIQLPERAGAARARHIGSAAGSEPFVGFIDDDVVLTDGSMSSLALLCDERELAGASGVITNSPAPLIELRLRQLLYRGIFRDPRPLALLSKKDYVPSPVLSGGLVVLRRENYERCSHVLERYSGYTWGEDFELSFCISRRAVLGVCPSVRALNTVYGSGENRAPTEISVARLNRYSRFARRYAKTRRDAFHYLLVLFAVGVTATRARTRRHFFRPWVAELAWASLALLTPKGVHEPARDRGTT